MTFVPSMKMKGQMKEIGSIYPLVSTYNCNRGDNKFPTNKPRGIFLYSLCREALYEIAKKLSDTNRHVLIPAYTCYTIITPFEETGWTCHFFNVQRNLRIDTQNLIDLYHRTNAALLVVHPYFGMDLDEEEIGLLRQISKSNTEIVIDLTQCIFSKQRIPFVDYYVGSYRKWFPIPDGGFLQINNGIDKIEQPKLENIDFVTLQADAMYLRSIYFKSKDQKVKDISIRLNKMANSVVQMNIFPHRMSSFSYELMQKEDEYQNNQIRFSNFIYLYTNISDSKRIVKVCTDLSIVTTAPLYFTIYVDDRTSLQRLLAENGIYAPIIWPVKDDKVLISEDVKYIYHHLLAIPCDQRYSKQDMQHILDVINCF